MNHSQQEAMPTFITEADEAVRDHLSGATELATFLSGTGGLSLDERRLIVNQALVLFEQNYVHLPLKMAMYAVNPIQRLRIMQRNLDRQTPQSMSAEWIFHSEISEIFFSIKDLHTNYILPEAFSAKIAFLPFLIEQCIDAQGSRYLVTHVVPKFSPPDFESGVEITHWSGIPIGKAVDLNAARFAGGNPAARRSRGLESLTVRSLAVHLPPFEEWVTVTYRDARGNYRELRESWRVVDNLPPFVDTEEVSSNALDQGVDFDTDECNRAKVLLFAPHVVRDDAAGAPLRAAGVEIDSRMPSVFRARSVETPSGRFGHIRIFTFNAKNPEVFVQEFIRLIGLLPQNGLIVDVRGNGGGSMGAAECTLQTLTPRPIVPEPVQFLSTPLNLRLCQRLDSLAAWVPSLEEAAETGAIFSRAIPLTSQDRANAIGQQYFGPVVLIVNARCYSATDMFAAGFQDHRIGIVLGTDDNTGAGGANVWTQSQLTSILDGEAVTPYVPLPKGAGMRVAMRRTLRVGEESGTPVEDLGVVPDVIHRMTRRDLLEDNVDLLSRAGQLLITQPTHSIAIVDASFSSDALQLKLRGSNVDRVDVYIHDRPCASVDLVDGQADVIVPHAIGAGAVRVNGFASGELVTSRAQQFGQ